MMPSDAFRISSRCCNAPARSILAMRNGCLPHLVAAARTASMSAALSTNDWLTASTPCCSANSRQARSCSVKALMPRSMPGMLRPFRDRSSPPTATTHSTSVPVTRSTVNCTSPSFRNSRSPGFTTWGRRSKLMETRLAVPTISSVVNAIRSPGRSAMGSGSSLPMRILGPGRSAMMATRCPVARAAARMRAIRSACPLKSPWEKLSRATFIPARIRRSSISGDSEAGPMVATIFVLWFGSDIRASPSTGRSKRPICDVGLSRHSLRRTSSAPRSAYAKPPCSRTFLSGLGRKHTITRPTSPGLDSRVMATRASRSFGPRGSSAP